MLTTVQDCQNMEDTIVYNAPEIEFTEVVGMSYVYFVVIVLFLVVLFPIFAQFLLFFLFVDTTQQVNNVINKMDNQY